MNEAASAQTPEANYTKDKEALRFLKEVEWPRAYREQDVALLDRILAAEFQMIDGEGGWSTKANEIEQVRRSKWINKHFRFEINRLEVFENGTAVVAGRGVALGPQSDPDGGYQYQSSNILIRRGGRWQAISSHVSGFRVLTAAELEKERIKVGLVRPGCAPNHEKRTSLLELATRKFEITDPVQRQQKALELIECLSDPDPKIRDDIAFTGISTWLRSGLLDEAARVSLTERLLTMIDTKEDAAGFRRSFAALTLSEIARADRIKPSLPPALRSRIVETAAVNIETVKDYRGYDPDSGWRHAVAHGADLVLQVGLHPATTPAEGKRLLDALAKQIAPHGVLYTHGEPERLSRAVFFIYGRGLLSDEYWDTWFQAIGTPAVGKAPTTTEEVLARVHDTTSFLNSISFSARANPSTSNGRLAMLADRELRRFYAR